MFVIRKFVGYTGAAAGLGAALALAFSSQTGQAAAPIDRSPQPAGLAFTPSGPCADALAAIKAWFVADRLEDNAARMALATDQAAAETADQQAVEVAALRVLFTNARTACAPAVTSTTTTPTFAKPAISGPCASAISALKAAWAQGRPTTMAQWQNLQTLAQAVRTTCGFTWSGER
jgi:NAD(P)-dependent dehydrogenase (short-subunit alcohol dehydrogenase family)